MLPKKPLVFYDIEVLKHDFIACFIFENGERYFIHNDIGRLHDIINNYRLVGYNNYHYDDVIISRIKTVINPNELFGLSMEIIEGSEKIKPDRTIDSLDCIQQIGVGFGVSLKQLECNRGHSIIEGNVSWDIDRPLNDAELDEMIKYCFYDVEETKLTYYEREQKYFKPKIAMADDIKNIKWNTTTLSIKDFKKGHNWYQHRTPQKLLDLVPSGAIFQWESPEIKKYTYEAATWTYDFSKGGGHGVTTLTKRNWKNVKHFDVVSMYPNIIINHRILGDNTELLKTMLRERLDYIKAGNIVLNQAAKLKINSIYGLLSNKYSKIYNPMGTLTTCIIGQIAIFTLAKQLDDLGYEIININTDGIFCVGGNDEVDNQVMNNFENQFNLTLEKNTYASIYQKDVNNIITVDEYHNIVVKGSLKNIKGDDYHKVNSLSIVNLMIINKLVFDKSFTDTLIENKNNLILFQMVLKATPAYPIIIDSENKTYQKVNRAFAVKNGVEIFKSKTGTERHKIENVPLSVHIFNGDITTLKELPFEIDYNYYIELAEHKIKGW